jgi:hypothetical protein
MTAAYIQSGLATAPPDSPTADRTYLGWFDADKKRPAVAKLTDACARYREKFAREPTVVLCNIVDAEELRTTGVDVVVRDVLFLGTRGTFYVGDER